MKKRCADVGLVVEYLENITRTAIKRYPEYARRRSGVYALYKGEDLYCQDRNKFLCGNI